MKGKLAALTALGALVALYTKVFAEDYDIGRHAAPPFSVIYLDDVEPRSEKKRIKSMATKSRLAAIQGEIAGRQKRRKEHDENYTHRPGQSNIPDRRTARQIKSAFGICRI